MQNKDLAFKPVKKNRYDLAHYSTFLANALIQLINLST